MNESISRGGVSGEGSVNMGALFIRCVKFLSVPVLSTLLFLPLNARSSDSTGIDTALAVSSLENDILTLRRKELDTETRIERLRIDIQAIEKKWQEARETDAESRLLDDSISGPALKTKVLWEQLSAYRTDLENASLLLVCFRKHRSILRTVISARQGTEDLYDQWKAVIDSIVPFRALVAEECRWRNERLAETRFELAAVEKILSETAPPPEERRLLVKRKNYLDNKVASDSILNVHGVGIDSLLAVYQADAREALKQITLRQQTRRLYRRILGVWSFELHNFDGKPLTVGKIILAILVIFIGLKIAQVVSKLIAHAIKRKSHLDTGVVDAGQKLFFYCFTALFTLYALYMLQVPLTAFTVIGGALALGLGFGSQNILKNFISGIILLLERPMKAGDFLEIDGAIGTVESIGLRSTRIRTPGNVHMVIPNSSFLEKNVINWTLSDRLIRLELQVGIQYGSPVYKAKQLLFEAAEKTGSVLKKPEPEVLFSDFGDNALLFHLYFWMRIATIIDRKRISSELRFAINDLFNAAGIVIAYPQRDVHLDTLSPLRVRVETKKSPNDENASK
ncbi:MAG: mechanosensitive ion channel [Chitinispirillaceae bacterium]|nr:mechanosensitive ion channel [Chitinispirillaceae bacterium]